MKKNVFLVSAKEVEVRANKQYVSLVDQFLNNWDSCHEMWVAFHRKKLPTQGDNTNNWIERSFWTLKLSIQTRFPSLPSIEKSVVHLVSFCEQRILEGIKQANLKSVKIYDPDPEISSLNEAASLRLNERGCVLYHKSLKALQTYRGKMFLESDGILEKFDEDQQKVYRTILARNVTAHSIVKIKVHVGIFCSKGNMQTFLLSRSHFSTRGIIRVAIICHVRLLHFFTQNLHQRSALIQFEYSTAARNTTLYSQYATVLLVLLQVMVWISLSRTCRL